MTHLYDFFFSFIVFGCLFSDSLFLWLWFSNIFYVENYKIMHFPLVWLLIMKPCITGSLESLHQVSQFIIGGFVYIPVVLAKLGKTFIKFDFWGVRFGRIFKDQLLALYILNLMSPPLHTDCWCLVLWAHRWHRVAAWANAGVFSNAPGRLTLGQLAVASGHVQERENTQVILPPNQHRVHL